MLPQRIMRERAGNVGGIRFDDHKTSVRRQFGEFGDFDILKTPVIHLRQIGVAEAELFRHRAEQTVFAVNAQVMGIDKLQKGERAIGKGA